MLAISLRRGPVSRSLKGANAIRSDSSSSRSDIGKARSKRMHFGPLCDKKFYYAEWETLIAP